MVKNLRRLACKFDLDQSERNSSQVNASARKAWPNLFCRRYPRYPSQRSEPAHSQQLVTQLWLSGISSSLSLPLPSISLAFWAVFIFRIAVNTISCFFFTISYFFIHFLVDKTIIQLIQLKRKQISSQDAQNNFSFVSDTNKRSLIQKI